MEKKIYNLKDYLIKDENGNIKCTIKPEDYYLIMSLDDLPGEEWRTIKGCSLYQVSNMGRIKAIVYEKWYSESKILRFYPAHIVAQGVNQYGYLIVPIINDDGKRIMYRVNRLVLETFLGNPQNLPDACHKNENRRDNRLINLEWGTHSENLNGVLFRQKMSKSMGTNIKCDGHEFTSIKAAARFYNVPHLTMWKWITGRLPMPKEWQERGLQKLEV